MTINDYFVSGNLTRDPEIRQAGSTDYVTFGLASNRRWPKRGTGEGTGKELELDEAVVYWDVKVWKQGLKGQIMHDLTKGDGVVLMGRVDFEQWESAEGDKRSKHILTVTTPAHEVLRTQSYTPRSQINGGGNSGGGSSRANVSNPLDDDASDDGPDW